jgi:protein gp37
MTPTLEEDFKTTTWNPVTGCDRVSPGCDHCYALAFAGRLKAMGSKKYQTDGDPQTSGPGFGVALHPDALKLPYTWRRPRIIFVTSMGDLFHPDVPLAFIQDVFKVMNETPRHIYQLLTKRPGRARKLMSELDWPGNLWFGTSVEDERFAFRIDQLRATPAPLKFVSAEPLLGPLEHLNLDGIGWVIVAGESGPEHRPMRLEWATSLRDQASAAHIPFYFKQWGGAKRGVAGRELEGRLWDETPLTGAPAAQ